MSEHVEQKQRVLIQRVGGRLHRLSPVLDSAGRVMQYAIAPLKVELRRRDVMQVLVGASIFAVPVGFTEETWTLGARLPLANVLGFSLMSLLFVSAYVYASFYRGLLREHLENYVIRVLVIYLLSLLVVGLLLTLIQQADWTADPILAAKRVVLVAFPATMSAAVSDSID